MQLAAPLRMISAAAVLATLGAGAIALPASQAADAHSAMTVTDTGKITKIDSKTSLTISVKSKFYVVTTNDMTHVKIDGKAAKFSRLKKGETVTVKGSLNRDTITATSVTEGM